MGLGPLLAAPNISPLNSSWTPRAFCTYFYNYARRLRLEKLLWIELSRSSNGYFKPLLDPGGGFTSETAGQSQRLYSGVGIFNWYCGARGPVVHLELSGLIYINRAPTARRGWWGAYHLKSTTYKTCLYIL